jgi:hypothetical protein
MDPTIFGESPSGSKLALLRAAQDGTPKLSVKETEYGYLTASRRNAPNNQFFWTMSQWMVPMYSYVANIGWPKAGRAWVPIDDQHTTVFGYSYNAEQPFTVDDVANLEEGQNFPPKMNAGKHSLADGYVIDTFLPIENRESDYLIDREIQRTVSFTGIYGVNSQDRSVQESMLAPPELPQGSIVDRTREHLGTTDIPTIALRRRLIRMARDLENGIEPKPAQQGDLYRVRSPGLRESPIADFDELVRMHLAEESVARI